MYLNEELSAKLNELLSLRVNITDIANAISLPEQLKKEFFHFADRLTGLAQGTTERASEEKDNYSDYRLRTLLVRNFRKYGKVTDNPDAYFGLDADKSDLLVLLGDNGSGKSSIFDAAEYLFTGNIGEAEYRAFEAKSFCSRDENDYEIIAITKNGTTVNSGHNDIPNSLQSLPLPYFFISENSIYQVGKMLDGDNFFPYFCELLGLGDLYRLANGKSAYEDSILEKISQHIDAKIKNYDEEDAETTLNELRKKTLEVQRSLTEADKKEIEKRLYKLQGIYKSWLSLPAISVDIIRGELHKANRWATLYLVPEFRDWMSFSKDLRSNLPKVNQQRKSLKETLENKRALAEFDTDKALESMKTNLKQLIDNINALLSKSSSSQDLQDIIDLSENYRKLKDSQIQKDLSDETIKNIKSVPSKLRDIRTDLLNGLESYVSEVLDDQFKSAVISLFKNTFLSEEESITIGSLENHTLRIDVNGVSINKYFNTFRYRLFFLIIQTALCLRIMKSNKVLFPIMLDDIFYANDYHNKTELCKFFDVVSKISDDLLGDDIKPQMIFLSHDEQLVMTMNQKAIGNKWKVEYGRILNLTHIENMEMTIRPLPKEEESPYNYRNIFIPIYK